MNDVVKLNTRQVVRYSQVDGRYVVPKNVKACDVQSGFEPAKESELIYALGPLLSQFKMKDAGELGLQVIMRSFTIAFDDLPLFAVEACVRDYLKFNVKGQSDTFMPSSAQMVSVIRTKMFEACKFEGGSPRVVDAPVEKLSEDERSAQVARAKKVRSISAFALSAGDVKKIEQDFFQRFRLHPNFGVVSKRTALDAWFKLDADQRSKAGVGFEPYLAACAGAKLKRAPVAIATYLKDETLWTNKSGTAKPSVKQAAVFGKEWGALMLIRLLGGVVSYMQRPTRFIQMQIDNGGEKGEAAQREWVRNHGYPLVSAMLASAAEYRGVSCKHVFGDELALMGSVKVGSDVWLAWQDLFKVRNWPFMLADMGSQEYVYLPYQADHKGSGPDDVVASGLAAFEALVVKSQHENGATDADEK